MWTPKPHSRVCSGIRHDRDAGPTMLTTLVLALTLGVAVADVGYQYKAPINPFGASTYQFNKYNSGFSSTTPYPAVSFGKASSTSSGLLKPVIGTPSTFALTSSGTSGNFAQGLSGSTGYLQKGQGASPTPFGESSSGSSFKHGLSNTGSLEQGAIASTATFNQGSYKTPATFGQGANTYSGSFGQGLSASSSSIGQDSSVTGGYNNGLSSSGLSSRFGVGSGSGSSYKVLSPSSFSSKYNVLGSNYNTFANPAASFGTAVTGSGLNTKSNVSPGLSSSTYQTRGSGSYNIPGQQGAYHGSFTQNTGYEGTYQTSIDTSGLDNIGNYYQSASAANQFVSSNQYQNTVVQNYPDYHIQRQPVQVFKHYYVHAIPEDKETPKQLPPIVLPPPQKHYKVIFIKAPTQQPAVPQFIPVPQQNEEKTIVYVLVKKPEDAKNIVLPKFEQKAPSKPDVFFIKYNDKQDSQALIDTIVNDYNKGGVSATFSGTSGGLGGGSSSGFKTGSLAPSPSIINNSNKGSSGSSSASLESIFGKNPNLVTSFGSQIGDISTVTPSSVAFSSSSTFSPSTTSPVFDGRFGTNSENAVSSVTGSPLPTASYRVKPINNLSSANSYSTASSITAKPSVSFGSSISGSNFGLKPSASSGSSSSFSGNYVSGASPLVSTGNIATKPSKAAVGDLSFSFGSAASEISSPSSGGSFSSGNSFTSNTVITP